MENLLFWTQNWISSRENILINTMMHCGVLGLTQLKVWNMDLLQKRRKQFEVCWTRRELLHQGALGLPDCLPATVSPPTSHYSATTFFPNQPKPSTHCAANCRKLWSSVRAFQQLSTHKQLTACTHKREGGSNTSGAISHHLWPGGNCTYTCTQILKFSCTQVLTHSMYSRYLYPGTRGRYPSKYFSPVQCSVSDFPPPLARRKL